MIGRHWPILVGAARSQEQRIEHALAAAGAVAWEWDLTTGESSSLAGSPDLLDLKDAGNEPFAVVHPADRDWLGRSVARAMRGEIPYDFEFRLQRPNGQIEWVRDRGQLDHTADGRLSRLTGVAMLVTSYKQTESAYCATFEQAAVGMAHVAIDGGFLKVNQRLCGILGRSRETLLGIAFQDITHPEDLAADVAQAEALLADTLQTYTMEKRYIRPDGSLVWAKLTVSLVRDAADAPAFFVSVVDDIEERKRAEQARLEHKSELEHRIAERTRTLADAARELSSEVRRREELQNALLQSQKLEALGQLTGGVAHDFNNVLQAVRGGLYLLRRRMSDKAAQELIGHCQSAAERGTKLISQLMAFARRQEMRPVLCDPGDVLRGIEDMVCHLVGKAVECRFEPAPETWPVIVDPVHLETVLLNLATNARDAMPHGGTLSVTLRNAPPADTPPDLKPGDHVLICVGDTGIGMDPETLQRATEPFFTTKPLGQGTGLGLASAHGFAVQSGGTLRLNSTVGSGTIVELFLPRAGVLQTSTAAMAESGRPAGESFLDVALHGNATLLLVDDDPGVRPVTAELLRELGYLVVEAASAEMAEVLAHTEVHIDMLVTDVVMPGANGAILAGRLREERPDLPVIFITGHANGADLRDALVLRKPFSDAALAQAVLAGLGRMPSSTVSLETVAATDKLRDRLRRPALREAYLRWLTLRGATGSTLPSPGTFGMDDLSDGATDSAYLLEVIGPVEFRFLRFGRALEDRLGRSLAGTVVGGTNASDEEIVRLLGGSPVAAYRRCVAASSPFYDYLRYALDDTGSSMLFERLILPLSADGTTVTHLFGIALFTTLPAAPTPPDPTNNPVGSAEGQ